MRHTPDYLSVEQYGFKVSHVDVERQIFAFRISRLAYMDGVAIDGCFRQEVFLTFII